ncbi:MAG: TonB-dependent receptor [Gammaproteobacteria bacterium]
MAYFLSLLASSGAATVPVLIDGAKANEAGGQFNFSDLTTDGLDRIEIVRTPQSALYGSDAITSQQSRTYGVDRVWVPRHRPSQRRGLGPHKLDRLDPMTDRELTRRGLESLSTQTGVVG